MGGGRASGGAQVCPWEQRGRNRAPAREGPPAVWHGICRTFCTSKLLLCTSYLPAQFDGPLRKIDEMNQNFNNLKLRNVARRVQPGEIATFSPPAHPHLHTHRPLYFSLKRTVCAISDPATGVAAGAQGTNEKYKRESGRAGSFVPGTFQEATTQRPLRFETALSGHATGTVRLPYVWCIFCTPRARHGAGAGCGPCTVPCPLRWCVSCGSSAFVPAPRASPVRLWIQGQIRNAEITAVRPSVASRGDCGRCGFWPSGCAADGALCRTGGRRLLGSRIWDRDRSTGNLTGFLPGACAGRGGRVKKRAGLGQCSQAACAMVRCPPGPRLGSFFVIFDGDAGAHWQIGFHFLTKGPKEVFGLWRAHF